MSILIKNILLDNKKTDIYIDQNRISKINQNIELDADTLIDGTDKAIFPGLVNGHTHAAMTLFRGYGDDLPLEEWLTTKIWPNEKNLTEEIVYWGSKLACLEMIKSGTTAFNDMYYYPFETAKAVKEAGIRAVVSEPIFDFFDEKQAECMKQNVAAFIKNIDSADNKIQYALAPHAIYTVSGKTYQWVNECAKENNLLVHTHVAETKTEYENAIKNFGLSPIRYLNKLGILNPNLIIAHCLWLDKEEIQMLADNEVKIIHNPNSNLKLASGYRFLYNEMHHEGICVGLGTDGCSSSNNLDMIEAMKITTLLQKGWRHDPTVLPAQEMLEIATVNGSKAIHIDAGAIQEGKLADAFLVDLKTTAFIPNYNATSNLVYAANGSCVDTVICDGNIVMQNKKIAGEEEIIEKINEMVIKLIRI